MKLLPIEHKGIEYLYQLFERVKIVVVIKDGEDAYEIDLSGKEPVCSCPGFRYRANCWHLNIVDLVTRVPSVDEPWAEWAEDAELKRRQLS